VLLGTHPDPVEQVRDLVVELEEETFLAPAPDELHLCREALEGHLLDQVSYARGCARRQIRMRVFEDIVEEERDRAVLAQFVRKRRLGEERHRAPDGVDGVGCLAIPASRCLALGSSVVLVEDEDVADDAAEVLHRLSTPRVRSSRRGSTRRRRPGVPPPGCGTARPGTTAPHPRGGRSHGWRRAGRRP
jgi:hypothetical protein